MLASEWNTPVWSLLNETTSAWARALHNKIFVPASMIFMLWSITSNFPTKGRTTKKVNEKPNPSCWPGIVRVSQGTLWISIKYNSISQIVRNHIFKTRGNYVVFYGSFRLVLALRYGMLNIFLHTITQPDIACCVRLQDKACIDDIIENGWGHGRGRLKY